MSMTVGRFFLCCLLVVFLFIGCSRKEESLKQSQESSPVKLTLPQIPRLSLPYKPTNKDIQIALKNAGFYDGEIDGDIGAMTKQAIQEFQEENDLTVDGNVGPKTWAVLKGYLLSPKGTDVP
jgi:murein L,D-transpeptidase YcbB/YkuD